MIRELGRTLLRTTLRQVTHLPTTRKMMHQLSLAVRGPSIVFLRCRRLLPDTSVGHSHEDMQRGAAMTPAEFASALADAQKTMRFISADEAISSLLRGDRLLESAAVLTFDESFAATAELALPICEKLGIPALFFVTTGHLDGSSTLWDQEVFSRVSHAPHPLTLPWLDRVLNTHNTEAKIGAAKRVRASMISLDDKAIERRLADLRSRWSAPPMHILDRMLSDKEIQHMSSNPWVSIGAHGHRHYALSSLPDEALRFELEKPRSILQDLAGDAFADMVSYPFGRVPHYDARVVEAAQHCGYRAAFTSEPGVARPGVHHFRLGRLSMHSQAQAVNAYELYGVSRALDEVVSFVLPPSNSSSDALAR